MNIFDRLQQIINICNRTDTLTKGRVYLSNDGTPPKGAVVKRGRFGGRYYETKSQSPGHAKAEIGVARAIENLPPNLKKVKTVIISTEGQTKEAYKKIRTIQSIYNDMKKYLESVDTTKTSKKEVRTAIGNIAMSHIHDEIGNEWILPNAVDYDLINVGKRPNKEYYDKSDPKIHSRKLKGRFTNIEDNQIKHSDRYHRTGDYVELPMRGETNPIQISYKNDPLRSLHSILNPSLFGHSKLRNLSSRKLLTSPNRRVNNQRLLQKEIDRIKNSLNNCQIIARYEQLTRMLEEQNNSK